MSFSCLSIFFPCPSIPRSRQTWDMEEMKESRDVEGRDEKESSLFHDERESRRPSISHGIWYSSHVLP